MNDEPDHRALHHYAGLNSSVPSFEVLTVDEAAQRLKVSRSTIYRLIDAGELDRVHVRSRAQIAQPSIERYLDHQLQISRALKGVR